MNVLLINPEFPDTFWGLKNALQFIGRKAMLPPLGLLTVAGMLPDDWNLKFVDMNTTRLRDRHLAWADYVFLTAMLIQRASADRVIERCRQAQVPIVAGGPLFTSLPEDYVDRVDHLVLKEAELTLPPFLEDLRQGRTQKLYNTHDKPDLSRTPMPRWDLVDLRKYASVAVQYSRGCPFNCDFCDITTLFGRRIRTKRAEQVVAELEALYRLGWRDNVFFVDDNFIGNKAAAKRDLLPAITEWMNRRGHPFAFNTQASINLADDEELMQAMVQAGFDCVFIGIETPDEQCLVECNKVQNTDRDLQDCVARIQRAGMQTQAGFILGFDHDNPGVFDNLVRFIQNSGIVTAMVGLLNAPRGTRLYQRMLQEHRLLRVPTGDNTDCSMNFIPKMGLETLLGGYRRVMETLYSPAYHTQRIRTFLERYHPAKTRKWRIHGRELLAFVKSLWRLGVLEPGRKHYWKLLFWAMRRPRVFPLAVTFSIYGYHFRKIIRRLSNETQNRVHGPKPVVVSTRVAADRKVSRPG